jgi:pantetheine-phosphate adenylyltransferase
MAHTERIAVYAGSFDPPTLGHEWMVRAGARTFDRLIVAVGVNPVKRPMFSVEERILMLKEAVHDVKNVDVDSYTNKYLVNYAIEKGASFILRGIRDVSDYSYEHSMRDFNDDIDTREEGKKVLTYFLMPPASIAKISSSAVKGMVGPEKWEEAVARYVSSPVFAKLKEKLHV